jgi:hypothetical protein
MIRAGWLTVFYSSYGCFKQAHISKTPIFYCLLLLSVFCSKSYLMARMVVEVVQAKVGDLASSTATKRRWIDLVALIDSGESRSA